MIQIPAFKTKSELFAFLRENEKIIITAKKSEMKRADGVFSSLYFDAEPEKILEIATKAITRTQKIVEGKGEMPVTFPADLVINTTNIMDSHSDVHFPNLWNKSLKENKSILLLQEHQMTFDHIISQKIAATVQMMSWKDLGYKLDGETQALVFSTIIDSTRNPYMADQYWKGYVTNHSVGMRYVTISLAMNSESKWDEEYKATWDKYIDQIVNKDVVEEQGYFYAVTEAKIVEGSAVPLGSNFVTPTISIGKDLTLPEAVKDTPEEPPIDWSKIAKLINLKN